MFVEALRLATVGAVFVIAAIFAGILVEHFVHGR
jgi:hypothetical protein